MSLQARFDDLLKLYPSSIAWVKDVKFKLNVHGDKRKTPRPVLVISTHGLTKPELARLRAEYLHIVEQGCISFPIKERSKHLIVRIGEGSYNYGYPLIPQFPKFRKGYYALSSKRRLEVTLVLKTEEEKRLRIYLDNVRSARPEVLGGFNWMGTQATKGLLHDNRPIGKGRHNCSSWISTAPLGDQGEALLELLGGSRDVMIGTGPGWWTSWLAAFAPMDRVPAVIYWTPSELAHALKEEVLSDQLLKWDFRRT